MSEKSKDAVFDAVVKKIIEGVQIAPQVQPRVRTNVVEAYGKQMVRFGYEMSEWSVRALTDYLKGYNLWICGKVGVGKTFFFDVISKIRVAKKLLPIMKLSMVETQGWTMEDAKKWIDESEMYDVLIDDIGTEPEEMVSYGQKIQLFPYLLEMRMRMLGKRTHLTSNLGASDITKRYGLRVADRFVQYFKMCKCPDRSSRRKPTPRRVSAAGNGVL